MILILGIILTILSLVPLWFKWKFQHFQRRNIPTYPNPTIPYGNIDSPKKMKVGFIEKATGWYSEMKAQGHRYFGAFLGSRPMLMLVYPEDIKNILQKDFNYFTDRGLYYNEKGDPLSANLFTVGGYKWRNLRAKLTPTFTSGKLKAMFEILVRAGENLDEQMKKLHDNNEPVDIKDIAGCFTTDVIGSCAFGLECNSFKENDAPFRYYGRKIFSGTASTSYKIALIRTFPQVALALNLATTPKDVTDFFMSTVKDTIEYRKNNNITRKDFLQLVMDLNVTENEHLHDGKSLTFEEVAAQCFIFFVAGFETSSSTQAFALFEMAQHQDIQDKVREEITTVLKENGGKITYDGINNMKYMNQVVEETLRLHPVVPFVTRKCVQEYQLPNSDLVIDKDQMVFIPIQGLHHDSEYFPEPMKFDPDRFSETSRGNIKSFTYMPFGEGPRLCIGMRFGLMQTKVGLTFLLKKYQFTINSKTQMPIKISPKNILPTVEGGIWLNCETL